MNLKKSVIFGVFVLLLPFVTHAGRVGSDCTFNGIPLHGKVKIVTSFPDIKVKVVSNFEDLKVKKVTNFADDCGEWIITDSAFVDFKIQIVENFEDISIKYVDNFPGVN